MSTKFCFNLLSIIFIQITYDSGVFVPLVPEFTTTTMFGDVLAVKYTVACTTWRHHVACTDLERWLRTVKN